MIHKSNIKLTFIKFGLLCFNLCYFSELNTAIPGPFCVFRGFRVWGESSLGQIFTFKCITVCFLGGEGTCERIPEANILRHS